MARHAGTRARGFFFREERPRPAPALVERADSHERELRELLPSSTVVRLDIFAPDNAVVGGRAAVGLVNALPLDDLTDVIVDLSALSIGVAFPIVRHLLGTASKRGLNLHLVVADEPGTDAGIMRPRATRPTPCMDSRADGDSTPTRVRRVSGCLSSPGANGRYSSGYTSGSSRTRSARFFLFRQPTRGSPDELIEQYGEEFENTWKVDSRDIVYASERGPLDLYRTILRMDDTRQRVFEQIGGSQIILSPVGSKALAVGALMAALDRDFTIMYVEALSYVVDLARLDDARAARPGDLVHVWLHGEAYGITGSKEVAGS